MVHYINPANQVPWVKTGPAAGTKSFHRLITGKLKKNIVHWNHESYSLHVYIYHVAMSSSPLHKSCQVTGVQTCAIPWGKNFHRLIMGKLLWNHEAYSLYIWNVATSLPIMSTRQYMEIGVLSTLPTMPLGFKKVVTHMRPTTRVSGIGSLSLLF